MKFKFIFTLMNIFALCGCSFSNTQSTQSSTSKKKSSISIYDDQFTLTRDYNGRELKGEIVYYAEDNTYRPWLTCSRGSRDDLGFLTPAPNTNMYGFSYEGYDVFCNIVEERDENNKRIDRIKNYEVKKKIYLTYNKALDYGFFGTKITEEKIVSYYGERWCKSTETYWESDSTYKVSLDFFMNLGMWDSYLVSLTEDSRFGYSHNGLTLNLFNGIPLYSNDLSEIIGICVFHNDHHIRTYTKEDGYLEKFDREEFGEKGKNARNKNIGRVRFVLTRSDYRYGVFPYLLDFLQFPRIFG